VQYQRNYMVWCGMSRNRIFCLHTTLLRKQMRNDYCVLSSKCYATCNKEELFKCLTGL
jgi:hypothetical protein